MNHATNPLPFFWSGVNTIPTIRSEFSFKQFEEKLQKYAYQLACDAVSDPEKHGRITIKMSGFRMSFIETNEFTIKFFARHASLERNEKRKATWGSEEFYNVPVWGFDVEDKEYMDSNHRSKLSYYGLDMILYDAKKGHSETNRKKAEEIKQTVFDFISKLMEGVKAEPRFSLAAQVHH